MRAPRVVIVGAGFGGIAAAIELRRHGFEDVTLLEASDDLGGTWHDNTYPGCACDVPSHLYSFSFAQRRDWTRLCSPQPEILAYLRGVAREHGVDRWIAFGRRVTACAWDDEARTWTVSTDDGRNETADAVLLATGQLHQPALPRLEGAGTFSGHAFHSARWDHAYDLQGKRVGVIGTGASAVQFLPEIAGVARSVTVFQRTGNWFLPRRNRAYPAPVKAAIRRLPGLQAFRRRFIFTYCEGLTLAIRHPRTWGRLLRMRSSAFMRWQLRGRPDLRRSAWPDYTFGCKRVLFSSAYLPALRRPDVELVTERIERLDGGAVVTADGARRELDCLIYATGFRTNDFMFPMQITGAGGVDLRQAWAGGPHAHLGMTVPGFPSLFILYGPNTNTSGGSIVFYLEAQAAYVRQALQALRERGAAAIEVRPEVEAASDRALHARFEGTAWTRCDSWYQAPDGRIVTNWPGYMREYAQAVRRLDPADFTFLAPARRPDEVAAV